MSRSRGLLLVIAVATALYLPSLRNGFAYDDVAIIERDSRVHSLRALPHLLASPYWDDAEMGLYRPLVTASYAVDWTISGGSAAWFHFVNTLWNAAACGLLFLLLAGFAPIGAALAGALLFAAHPVHVEAVANVVGRAELMAAAFGFLVLWLWMRRAPTESLGAGRLIAASAALSGALLTKESAIMIPALVILLDGARGVLTPTTLRSWLKRNAVPFAVLLAVVAAYLVIRTAVLGDLGPGKLDPALEVGTAAQQRLTAVQIWPAVLRLLVFPSVLLADYGPRIFLPAMTLTPRAALGILLLAGMLAGGAVAFLRGRARLALVLLWVPIALLPAANLILPIGILLAERALYVPSAAVAFAVTFAAGTVSPVLARTTLIGAAVVTLLFVARTLVRIPEWRTTDSILGALARDRPDSFRAQWHAARIAVRENQPAVALAGYGRALHLWPYRRALVLEAARHAAHYGDYQYARRVSSFMLQRWPTDLDAARLVVGVNLDLADTTAARAALADALRIHPADSLLRRMRAALLPDSASLTTLEPKLEHEK